MSLSKRILDLDAKHDFKPSSCIDELRQGKWCAIVLRGIYSNSEMEQVALRLEQIDAGLWPDEPWVSMRFPEAFRGCFLGENLNLLETSLSDYLDREPAFCRNMTRLFDGIPGGTGRVFSQFSQIDQSRKYLAAPGPDFDTRYQYTTIRGHAQGGYIPIHCDNEQAWRPSYEHLLSLIEQNLFSFVLMIGKPLGGGNLKIYSQRIPVSQRNTIEQTRHVSTTDALLGDSVEIDLQPGDLVLADSGMHPHEVTRVIGTKTRWTMCSFMARAQAKHAVYCWG